MYAINCIAIQSIDNEDTEPKKWVMVFATVLDEYETNYVLLVSTKFQLNIQSLASSTLLSNQLLVAMAIAMAIAMAMAKANATLELYVNKD